MDENAIMVQVINGDLGKMGILYERYKRPLYGYFIKLTGGDQSSSEDLVHSVFYRAIKYKHSFRGTGSFAKWIFSIAHNTGIDFTRKRSVQRTVEINPDRDAGHFDDHKKLEGEESKKLLHKALNMLEPGDRELLVLGKLREMRYNEIAEITGLTESAIKTRICRALKKLRDCYLEIEKSQYEKARIG